MREACVVRRRFATISVPDCTLMLATISAVVIRSDLLISTPPLPPCKNPKRSRPISIHRWSAVRPGLASLRGRSRTTVPRKRSARRRASRARLLHCHINVPKAINYMGSFDALSLGRLPCAREFGQRRPGCGAGNSRMDGIDAARCGRSNAKISSPRRRHSFKATSRADERRVSTLKSLRALLSRVLARACDQASTVICVSLRNDFTLVSQVLAIQSASAASHIRGDPSCHPRAAILTRTVKYWRSIDRMRPRVRRYSTVAIRRRSRVRSYPTPIITIASPVIGRTL